MTRYAKPTSLEDALGLLSGGTWRVLAGGTDFYPALGSRPLREDVLDINGLAALEGIEETDAHIVIGGRTSWSRLISAPLPAAFDALKAAAREVGAVQVQNAGTIAGNLCNASPAADGVPPLLVLDAEVELRSVHGSRQTARRSDELVTAIRVPKARAAGGSAFFKLGARRYLVISIAMAAVRLVPGEDATIGEAAVAVGACSAVAMRLPGLEAALVGRRLKDGLERFVEDVHFAQLSPIDDVRGSADYRRLAAQEIVARTIAKAAGGKPTTAAAA